MGRHIIHIVSGAKKWWEKWQGRACHDFSLPLLFIRLNYMKLLILTISNLQNRHLHMVQFDNFFSYGNNQKCFWWMRHYNKSFRPKTHRTGLNKPSSHNRRGKRGTGCSKLRDNRWEGQDDWEVVRVTRWGASGRNHQMAYILWHSGSRCSVHSPVSIQSILRGGYFHQEGGGAGEVRISPPHPQLSLVISSITSKGIKSPGSWKPIIV